MTTGDWLPRQASTTNVVTAVSRVKGSTATNNAKKLMKKTISEETTVIAEAILRTYSKLTLCQELDLSRPTLDHRLENHDWKKLEIKELNRIYGRIFKK